MDKFIVLDAVKIRYDSKINIVDTMPDVLININYIACIEPIFYNGEYSKEYYSLYIFAGKSLENYTITKETYNKLKSKIKNYITYINNYMDEKN